jgi:hypothetical protein
LENLPDILGGFPDLIPVGPRRNLEAMVFRISGEIGVATGLSECSLRLLVEDVAETLKK